MDIEDFVTVSGSWEIPAPRPQGIWRKALEEFLLDLAGGLEQAGCPMIGHVKGMLGGTCGSPLYFSLTSFSGPPHFRGGHPAEDEAQVVSINVIAAGISPAEIRRILEEKLRGRFLMPGA